MFEFVFWFDEFGRNKNPKKPVYYNKSTMRPLVCEE